LSIADQSRHFIEWWSKASYTIQSSSDDLAEVLGPNAVITGSFAPPLRQGEDPIRCLVHMFSLQEVDRFFQRFPITHVIVEDKADEPFIREFNELAWTADIVTVYTVGELSIVVLRVAELTDNPVADAYIRSPFERMQQRLRTLPQDSLFAYVSRFVADSASHYSGWAFLGDLYARVDSVDAALASYARAIEYAPDDFVLLAQYGSVSWQKYRTDGGPQDRERAIRLLRRAHELSPGNTLVRQLLDTAEQ
jgi:tetratricopeptide (TPR) repeat protein